MTDSAALLRMLEPAVRPVSTPAGGGRSPQLPLEQRDFESLLQQLQQTQQTEQSEESNAGAAEKCDPLKALGQLTAIENASLRGWMNQHAVAASR